MSKCNICRMLKQGYFNISIIITNDKKCKQCYQLRWWFIIFLNLNISDWSLILSFFIIFIYSALFLCEVQNKESRCCLFKYCNKDGAPTVHYTCCSLSELWWVCSLLILACWGIKSIRCRSKRSPGNHFYSSQSIISIKRAPDCIVLRSLKVRTSSFQHRYL